MLVKLVQETCTSLCKFFNRLVWNRTATYSAQETCTTKNSCKKACQTCRFLVQFDLYKFLVEGH